MKISTLFLVLNLFLVPCLGQSPSNPSTPAGLDVSHIKVDEVDGFYQTDPKLLDLAKARGIASPEVLSICAGEKCVSMVISTLDQEFKDNHPTNVGMVVFTDGHEEVGVHWLDVVKVKSQNRLTVVDNIGETYKSAVFTGGNASQKAIDCSKARRKFWCKVLDIAIEILKDVGTEYLKDLVTGMAPPTGVWTGWLDRDGPGGSGDYETLKHLVSSGKVCSQPLGIQCRTSDGRDWREAKQYYICDLSVGGVCVNRRQEGARCLNYQVRFLCPEN